MRIIIQDDTGHPVDSIIIVDELVELSDVTSIAASMLKDYVDAKEVINKLAERRRKRQQEVKDQFTLRDSELEDVPF